MAIASRAFGRYFRLEVVRVAFRRRVDLAGDERVELLSELRIGVSFGRGMKRRIFDRRGDQASDLVDDDANVLLRRGVTELDAFSQVGDFGV